MMFRRYDDFASVPTQNDPLPSCYIQKPQTNADRIRAMTDEELAEYLARVDKYENYAFDWLYWLQQEAEE